MAYLRPGQAARLLGVDPKTIRRWFLAGKIHGYRTPGGQCRILDSEIARITEERQRTWLDRLLRRKR